MESNNRLNLTARQLSDKLSRELAEDILALVASTTYESTPDLALQKQWKKLAHREYLVMVRERPAVVTVLRSREVNAAEILVPFLYGSPGHLLLRNGKKHWSFSKYDPISLGNLVCRPELGLSQFQSFCDSIKGMREKAI